MTKKSDVLDLIELAANQEQTSLDLSGHKLTSLPPQIGELSNLRELKLLNNELKDLPPEISKLSNLIELNISSNRLTNVPQVVFKLTALQRLYLWGNDLSSLPDEISELKNLTELTLGQNKLKGLPSGIATLRELKDLSIWGNGLVTVPPEVFELTSLSELDLVENNLTSVAPGLSKLSNLTILKLASNELSSIPPEIGQVKSLTELDLHNNNLTSLPSELFSLTNLRWLNLTDNPLPIPREIVEKPSDVKALFAALTGVTTGQRLNEAKMLVVGDGKVGKSSVVQQLLQGTFDPHKQTTLGVDIRDEMQVVQGELEGGREPITLNIWDFGGQEIQHSTHQFFLTTRSLYLLVLDARKGDQIGNIEYWLKLIESFGGDSPIIIAINQIDQLKGQRELNIDRNALRSKYNIRGFVPTSCADGQGILELKEVITTEVLGMKHVHDVWPAEWIAVKNRLSEMRKDYIPVEIYEEICGEEGLNDLDLRASLLGLLHDLGTVIRFPGDTQVLNPKWVTQGVYGLLTSPDLVKTQGQFDLRDVDRILRTLPEAAIHYPRHTHQRLIRVMQHFELCFEFTDRLGHYLIPRHLHDTELDIPWDDSNALKFEYQYVEALPDSIVSRFIVRMNQYIQKQYYWKNGVFLQSGENRAKVKADLVDRKIFISIIGKEKTRRAFLAVLRSAFDEINGNFKIEIKQMIPVPGYPDVLVSYKDLLVHEEMSELEILIPEVKKKFSVRGLLDGVEDFTTRMKRRERDNTERRLSRHMSAKLTPEPLQPVTPRNGRQMGSLMSFVLGFVIMLGAIVGAAVAISNWVSVTAGVMTSIVIIGALLAIGVVGAMDLRSRGVLSEANFLKLMIESYRRLPLLRGQSSENDKDAKDS